MFKKTKIAAITAAVLGMSAMALAPSAQAVSLNDSAAAGQVLIFPYYNVNNGFSTAFNIINTTNDYKAVKIRFRESRVSNDILDYNLYMSPQDIYTMSVQKVGNEVRVFTDDKSCTFPAIPAAGQPFRGAAVYDNVSPEDETEGYLEIIEMGVITDAKVKTGILHDSNGIPDDCKVIFEAWDNAEFEQGGAKSNVSAIDSISPKPSGYPKLKTTSESGYYGLQTVPGLSAPTGGLVGSSILLNTTTITGFVAEPTVIVNYSTVAQHYLSSDENFYLLPSLASGNVTTTHTLADNFASVKTINWPTVKRDWGLDDLNVAPRTEVPSGINPMPIAHVMAATQLSNQYFVGQFASTDWVISTPMRKHGIFNDYEYHADSAGYNSERDIPVNGDKANGFWEKRQGTDISSAFTYFDREEQRVRASPQDFSPPTKTNNAKTTFDREVNILALGDGTKSSVLGSANKTDVTLATGFNSGWGFFTFNESLNSPRYSTWLKGSPTGNGINGIIGVPVAGFAAATGELGPSSVGETFPHTFVRNR